MSERVRRLKSLEALAQRRASAILYSDVKAAEERLSGGRTPFERISQRLEMLREGLSGAEINARTKLPDYPGRENDAVFVHSYYAQWYPAGYDAKAELMRRLDAIRERQQKARELSNSSGSSEAKLSRDR